MDWTILKDIGIFTIATGFITWLIKQIFINYFSKDVERYKHELKEKQIQFSKLQDKRAEIIDELYNLLDDFDMKMGSLISPLQLAEDIPKKEKIKIAGEAGQKFVEFYSKKKIYFNKSVVTLLDKLNKEFKSAWIDFTTFPITDDRWESAEIKKQKWEFWQKAWETTSKKIPPIKEQLEDEFRKVLGVK